MPLPRSILCARLAAAAFGLTTLGCVVNWFDEGAIGVAAVVVLATVGVVLTVAAHRLSKRGA
jgi:hypothetical protein